MVGLVKLFRFMFSSCDWGIRLPCTIGICHCLMAIYTMWFDNKFCVACGAWTFYGKVGNAHNHFECMHSHCGHKFTSCGQNTRINPILYTFNYDSEDVVTMMNVPHSSHYVVPSFLGIRPLIPHGYNHSNDFSLWLEIHGLFVGRLYEHMWGMPFTPSIQWCIVILTFYAFPVVEVTRNLSL